jgi:ATP-dependent DNA helicase RecG
VLFWHTVSRYLFDQPCSGGQEIPLSLLAPMHKPDLSAFFAPLTALKRVGPDRSAAFKRAIGGERLIDLLFHLPEAYIDRRAALALVDVRPGMVVTLTARVTSVERPQAPRRPARLVMSDGTGIIAITYFNHPPPRHVSVGGTYRLSGRVTEFNGRLQINDPGRIEDARYPTRIPAIEPIWRLTAGLYWSHVMGAIEQALSRIPPLPEWHEAAVLRRERWPSFAEALRQVHLPAAPPVGELAETPPRRRLAYDELLAGQVAMALIRGRIRVRPGRSLIGDGRLREEVLKRFGHRPTRSQERAVAEIDADLAAPRRMLRLLQGDVGSGKTLVALLAMLRAVEAGAQAALMAPTEVLARQHARTLSTLSPVPVALLTGSVKGNTRARILAELADGSVPMVVGTHALFQAKVTFHDLGLAVIDEQHRFGVDQRLQLGGKGETTDVLVMTATPIPRTLLLTQWGEMDTSRLSGKPVGQQRIRTTLHSLETLGEVLGGIARILDDGAQIYWVCPLVAENLELDIAAAEERFAMLRQRFGPVVGLAHGQQAVELRDAALADFAAGRMRLLVATTVVEVGVDVPQASVMVVEHAERFGLAQLHQLRGRVGRGVRASFCLLLHEPRLGGVARRRLSLLRDTDDGFVIADEDFRLRGGGDALGTRQAGLPGYRLADPLAHEGLLHMAHRDAAVLLRKDPQLESARGEAVRVLLRLFERREAMRTLAAG